MDFLVWAWALVLGRLQSVFGMDSPYGPVALGGALVFAILFYVDARGKLGRPISFAGFFKSIFPRRLIWHPSSRLDMRLWFVNTVVFASAYGMLVLGGLLWRNITLAALTGAFGAAAESSGWPIWAILTIATIVHLRHSHMWIAFTGLAGRLFQSPAHHQIHHSDQPRHFNKNLGFALAVWDWLFGTLYVPEQYEKITFGVGAEHVRFDTVLKTFALPFRYSAHQLLVWASRLKARLRHD